MILLIFSFRQGAMLLSKFFINFRYPSNKNFRFLSLHKFGFQHLLNLQDRLSVPVLGLLRAKLHAGAAENAACINLRRIFPADNLHGTVFRAKSAACAGLCDFRRERHIRHRIFIWPVSFYRHFQIIARADFFRGFDAQTFCRLQILGVRPTGPDFRGLRMFPDKGACRQHGKSPFR